MGVYGILFLFALASFVAGQILDPATVKCGDTEWTWCDFNNGLIRNGATPRKCAGKCICQGHPSFYGENLSWKGGKCTTTEGYACGTSSDGKMEIHCDGSSCIAGRCRQPNFTKGGLGARCNEDVECE